MGKSSLAFSSEPAPWERVVRPLIHAPRPSLPQSTPIHNLRHTVRVGVVSPHWWVLIQKARFGEGALWNLPGGGVEPHERYAMQAARRETWEETGITLGNNASACRLWERVRITTREAEDLAFFFVSDELIKTHRKVREENTDVIFAKLFPRRAVTSLPDLNPVHKAYVEKIDRELRALGL